MKSFTEFIKDEYIALETILYHDEHLFKYICEGKYEPTPEELEKIKIEQHLIKEDEEKSFFENDKEIELIKIYQENPDSPEGRDALDKLVENKMGLIYSKVNKHLLSHPQQSSNKDDLVQEAVLALMKAIDTFNVDSNVIFNAYALKYITGAILNTFNPNRKKIETLRGASLDEIVSGSRGEWADKDTTIADQIADDQAEIPGVDSFDDLYQEKRALLKDWISQLPEREQKAIEMYFPERNEDKKTLEEIGKELQMSKMGVKKLIDRIITNLRKRAAEVE